MTSSLVGGVWSVLSLLSSIFMAGIKGSKDCNRSSTNSSVKTVPLNNYWRISGMLSLMVIANSEAAILGLFSHLQLKSRRQLKMASSLGFCRAGP